MADGPTQTRGAGKRSRSKTQQILDCLTIIDDASRRARVALESDEAVQLSDLSNIIQYGARLDELTRIKR